MNHVTLMGRLCGEIELKRTQNGNVCTNFSLAVDRYANGNKTADFIRCVAWGKTAENIGNNRLYMLLLVAVKKENYVFLIFEL